MRFAGGSIAFALAFLATPCWGAFINLQWTDCPAVTFDENKNFTGPGTYRQVVVGSGFNQSISGYTLQLRAQTSGDYDFPFTPLPNAWRFDPAGCQAGDLHVSLPSGGCPTLASSAQIGVTYLLDVYTLYITVDVRFPAAVPNPSTTYDLVALDFDHSNSVIGSQGPTSCGGADHRVCFSLREAHCFDQFSEPHAFNFEVFSGVSWQAPNASCFADLPVTPLPWTGTKALYR